MKLEKRNYRNQKHKSYRRSAKYLPEGLAQPSEYHSNTGWVIRKKGLMKDIPAQEKLQP